MHPGCHIDQVYRCREPIDFRKSIAGLSVLVERNRLLKYSVVGLPDGGVKRLEQIIFS